MEGVDKLLREIDFVVTDYQDGNTEEELRKALNVTLEQMKSREKFIEIIFEKSRIGMLIGDVEGKVIGVNKALCQMLGYSGQEFNDLNLTAVTHPEDIPRSIYMFNRLFEENLNSVSFEQRLLKKDGTPLWTSTDCSQVRNNKGHPLYLLVQVDDISARKSAEDKIEEQREELKQSQELVEFNKLKNKFFANLSHEFKTPLNLIFSSLQLMEGYLNKNVYLKNDKRFMTYLKVIRKNGYRLLRLVHNLLDLTKIDADEYELKLKKCDIIPVIRNVIDMVANYMEENKRSFLFETEVNSKIMLCDPLNIERILLNLLSNALKFTSEGDQIKVSILDKGANLVIGVQDTGIGIKEKNKQLIFEKFRKADETYCRVNEGSGIGLSLVKSLVKMHGGNIMVESEYGKGSEFIIELPVIKGNGYTTPQNYSSMPQDLIDKVYLEFSDIYYP